jgi:CHAT domain-containing protein
MEALNRLYLADLLKENREYEEAARELDRARALVRGLKPGPTLDNLKWQAQLGGFEVEMAAGHAGQVIRELDTLTASAGLRSASDQMRFHQIRGLALASAGDWRRAAESFEKAIEWNQRKAASLASYLDRVPVLESAAVSYRNLAEIQLVRLHDAKKSLATWLKYQGVSADEMSRPSLVFAALATKVVVWKTGMDGVSFRVVDAAPAEVAAACRRFLRLCSTPHSAQSDIKELGGRLAGWLIEPELRSVAERTVYLRTEGWLSSIPFSVLDGKGGRYLGRDRDFVYLAGPDGDARRDRPVASDSSALVVAVPRANAPEQGQLSVLQATEHEAAEVAEYFRRPVLLTGSAVSVESIGSNSGRSDVFHFSGHGWANGGNGALILPPAPDGSPRFETAREISRQDWRECSLAVLSACLTAAGEERGAVNNQSLVRAMLSAGARRVVAARWSVDSETTRLLMRHFYKRLLSGEQVPSSLVSAGAELAKTSEWEHPYYWAAFDTFTTVRDR